MNAQLKRNYQRYQKKANKSKSNLTFFQRLMPEIVFRTTKLEGEPVTRRMVKAIFG